MSGMTDQEDKKEKDMNLVVAVVEDLFTFAQKQLLRNQEDPSHTLLVGGMSHDYEQLDSEIAEELHEGTYENERDRDEVIDLPGKIASYQTTTPQKNTVMYVSSTNTPLRSEPSILRDTNIGTISYGTMVMVLEAKNGWAHVIRGNDDGWVDNRDLAERAADILPQFVKGEENHADDPNTVRLRAIIHDEFSGGSAGLPLQSHEYVFYKLLRKDIRIDWPKIRPRSPGKWSDILASVEGVTLSVTPKSASVMEFFTEEGIGRLAYVEAVFPDESIQISEVNWPENGIYSERVLSKEEWDAFNPTFIRFS